MMTHGKRRVLGLAALCGCLTLWTSAGVIFEQDFSSSTVVGDYVSTPGTATTLGNISADASSTASVSIDSQQLKMHFEPDGELSQGQSHVEHYDLGPSLGLMSLRVVLTIVNTGGTANANPRAWLRISQLGTIRSQIDFKVKADVVEVVAGGSTAATASGAPITLDVYHNNSTGGVGLQGGDGVSRTLDPDRYTVYVDNEILVDNIAVNKDAALYGFAIDGNTRAGQNLDNCDILIDSVLVRDDLALPVATATTGTLIMMW